MIKPFQNRGASDRSAEVDRLTDQLRRLQDEFDNYRRRAEKDREAQGHQALKDFITTLLPIHEVLRRETVRGGLSPEVDAYVEGFRAIEKQLTEALSAAGLDRIDAEGRPFDPERHQAVGSVPPDGYHPENTVKEVVQDGYEFHGQILRPARVIVVNDTPPPRLEIRA